MADLGLVKDKVQRILVEGMNLQVRLLADGYQVPYESTAVNISFLKQDDPDRVLVQCWATIVHHVPENPELYKWIAREGQQYHFGHAVWVDQADAPGHGLVTFDHTLLGDFLDPDELKSTVAAVALTADDLDDQIQSRFGGKRFVD